MRQQHEDEKAAMVKDFERQIAALKAEYEAKMAALGQEKDVERENLRSDMQLRIDELLRKIEEEK